MGQETLNLIQDPHTQGCDGLQQKDPEKNRHKGRAHGEKSRRNQVKGLPLQPHRTRSICPATASSSTCGMPSSREVLGVDLRPRVLLGGWSLRFLLPSMDQSPHSQKGTGANRLGRASPSYLTLGVGGKPHLQF